MQYSTKYKSAINYEQALRLVALLGWLCDIMRLLYDGDDIVKDKKHEH